MKINQHISEHDLIAFQKDTLSLEEQMDFLSHIGSCNHCSAQFAMHMSSNLIEAPHRIKENLLVKSQRPEVQIVVKSKEISRNMELLLYSLKVGTATVGALFLLALTITFGNPNGASWELPTEISEEIEQENRDESLDHSTSFSMKLRNNADKVSHNMQNFSNKIIKGGN